VAFYRRILTESSVHGEDQVFAGNEESGTVDARF